MASPLFQKLATTRREPDNFSAFVLSSLHTELLLSVFCVPASSSFPKETRLSLPVCRNISKGETLGLWLRGVLFSKGEI